jgi:mono/diheme cytochrome c family protein
VNTQLTAADLWHDHRATRVCLAASIVLLLAAGCADSATPEGDASRSVTAAHEREYTTWPDALAERLHGAPQIASVCGRGGADRVRDLFCSGAATQIRGLADLQRALEVGTNSVTGLRSIAQGYVTDLAITGHSTGLSARSVSAINPRVIAFRMEVVDSQVLALAFTRGEQMVELVTRDRIDRSLRFYVAGFRQACNATGCKPGDLLTPAIERDWTEVSLYDEADLSNTVLDCATCHQPAGPGTGKSLQMQELNAPWTHWFWRKSEGGNVLLDDYFAAKGDEQLAGMTAEQVEAVDPNSITTLILFSNPSATASFDSARIEAEVKSSAAALGGMQPMDNSVPGESPTWRAAYDRAKRGDTIALPYYDVKVTDPTKLARMTASYQAFRRGEITSAELPDLRDVFSEDPMRLAELGAATEPGLDGKGVLLQACSQCHNSRLDQGLSRARFRADLVGMTRAEKDLAIARLKLPEGSPLAMPPARMRLLSEESRYRAIEALQE